MDCSDCKTKMQNIGIDKKIGISIYRCSACGMRIIMIENKIILENRKTQK